MANCIDSSEGAGAHAASHMVGAHIRALRETRGLTQGGLAQAIYVARQTINNWETGKTLPDAPSLVLLSRFFEVSVDELLQGAAGAVGQEAFRARRKLFACLLALAVGWTLFLCLTVAQITVLLCASRALGPASGMEVYEEIMAYRAVLLWAALLVSVCMLVLSRYLAHLMKREDLHDAVEVAAYLEGASTRSVRPGNVLYQWLFENWTQTRGVAGALLALLLVVIVLLALAV